MDRETVALERVPVAGAESLEHGDDAGSRTFLGSWKWAAIVVAGCVVGLIAILNAHPFASASASERVSAKLGKPAVCVEVGAAPGADVQSRIYRCTVGVERQGRTQCFAITGHDVNQFVGSRRLGC